jgi:hypothetical protein
MTVMARDPIALTFESQRLGMIPGSLKRCNMSRDHSMTSPLAKLSATAWESLKSAAEAAIPLLEERVTEPDPSIDEIVEELERAFLISLVVILTSHNVTMYWCKRWTSGNNRTNASCKATFL